MHELIGEKEQSKTKYHFVLRQGNFHPGKDKRMIFTDSSVCPGLPAQHIHLHGVLGSSQSALIDLTSASRKGRK